MLKTKKVSSGAKWEDIVGYSRAIQAGNVIEVAGTTAIDERGEVVGINDPYAQTKYIIQTIPYNSTLYKINIFSHNYLQ